MREAVRRRGVLITAVVLAPVVLVLGLVAVGSSASSGLSSGGAGVASVQPTGGPSFTGSAESGMGADQGLAPDALSQQDMDSAEPRTGRQMAPQMAPQTAPQLSKIAPGEPGPGPAPVPVDVAPDRSVVRNARLALTVTDLPAASTTVRDAAAAVGGFVAGEHSVDKSSSFTLRVPSDRLDEVMGRLVGVGTVTERFGQAQDVTDQVVDLQSRLATQQASVARVRALLQRANTVGEVVAVESELTAREAELESLQRRLASVNGRVALSTLTVSLTPTPLVAPDHGGGFLAGLAAGWRAFVAATASLLTALGAVLPFILLLAVVVAGFLLGRRAVRRHRAATAALAAVSNGAHKP